MISEVWYLNKYAFSHARAAVQVALKYRSDQFLIYSHAERAEKLTDMVHDFRSTWKQK